MSITQEEIRAIVSTVLHEQRDDIRNIVAAVLNEQKNHQIEVVDNLVLKAIATILTSFGIDEEDRSELRADFVHLRKWRKSVDQATSITFKAAVLTLVTGTIGAFWIGFKTVLGK